MSGSAQDTNVAPHSDTGRSGRNGALAWLWCSVAVVVVDQSTKLAAVELLEPASRVELLSMLALVLAYNTGAAFSILSTAGGWQRWFFTGLALVVCVIIIQWMRRVPRSERRLPLALSLMLGGAAGNAIDRIRIGAVVDFIDVHVGGWHWPAFNVADSAICVGAALLVLGTFRRVRE